MRPPVILLAVLLAPTTALGAKKAAVPDLPPPAPIFDAADQEIDALQERLTAQRAEAEPLVEQLGTLAARYVDPAAFPQARTEREALRGRLKGLLDAMFTGEQRFNTLREQTQVRKVVAGLQVMMKARDVPNLTGVEFLRSNVRLNFALETQQFRERAAAALLKDEDDFRAAESRLELEKRRTLELAGLGAGALLLLAVAALLVDNARLRRALRAQGRAALPPA